MRIQDKLRSLVNIWTLIIAICWLIAAGFIYSVVRSYFENTMLQSEIGNLNREIKAMRQNLANLEKDKQIFDCGDEKLSTILASLTSASQESKVSLGEISIGEEVSRESYKVLPITVQIKGNYNQIGKFINIIDRGDQRFQFWDIMLSTKETKGRGIVCKITGEFIVL